jgi:hypothetical protein
LDSSSDTEAKLLSRHWSAALLVVFTAAVAVAAGFAPRIPQSQSYHHFADQRAWLGIANFGDVASNLAFLVAGVWGFSVLLRRPGTAVFLDSTERWPYVVLFCGLILTAGGSAYYHLAPDNARLMWDRLPMTIVFMSLVAAIIMERVDLGAGLVLLPILLLIGIASVVQWHISERRGAGDLRFYAAVQVFAVLVVLLSLFMKPRYTRTNDLPIVGAFYVAAKCFELVDRQIFSAGHIVSGHTLKHLAAAGAGFWIIRMLVNRKAVHQIGGT